MTAWHPPHRPKPPQTAADRQANVDSIVALVPSVNDPILPRST
jgi:hypothetical protein